jgi:alkylation response protein AidB-like acyl-CoA dehydrogenase
MKFSFTDEQEEFRATLRRYFDQHSTTPVVRRLMDTEAGWDRAQWQSLNDQLGLSGVHIPEAFGGQGFGFVELGVVLEEMGRALVCAPFFSSTVLAGTALMNGATQEQQEELLPQIASGQRTAALAYQEDGGSWDLADVRMAATPVEGGYTLSGSKTMVVDGHTADWVLVLARTATSNGEEGLSIFLVEGDAPGLQRRLLQSVDATRKIAELKFASVPARLLGQAGAAGAGFERTLAQAATCLASEMVGGAERLRESSLEYSKIRVQFGRPIAALQSMKHKQADMLVDVELAKSAAYFAAASAHEDDNTLAATASAAKAAASEAYMRTAIHAVQIHGGIGFTWENDTHLWFKRAKSSEVFLGDPTWHRERLMRAWSY